MHSLWSILVSFADAAVGSVVRECFGLGARRHQAARGPGRERRPKLTLARKPGGKGILKARRRRSKATRRKQASDW